MERPSTQTAGHSPTEGTLGAHRGFRAHFQPSSAATKNSRDYPLNKIAERTIGYERLTKDDNFSGVGLEHAFGSKLRGKNGMQLMQKISNGKWKPISSNNKIEPIPGTDIISTINVGFQDITHHSLQSSAKFREILIKIGAKYFENR